MPTSRQKLEQIALILFEDDLEAWPIAGLIAFVHDTASSLQWSYSARDRRLKAQIEKLLQTAILEHDVLLDPPSKAQH